MTSLDRSKLHRLIWNLWRTLPNGNHKTNLATILLEAIRNPGQKGVVNTKLYEDVILVADKEMFK